MLNINSSINNCVCIDYNCIFYLYCDQLFTLARLFSIIYLNNTVIYIKKKKNQPFYYSIIVRSIAITVEKMRIESTTAEREHNC